MTFSIEFLFLITFCYLLVLFLVAYLVERNFIPKRVSHHPLVYVLSLGVYCSAWAFYGTSGLALEYGYGYLAYYLGISAAFVLYPVLLRPFFRITKRYELGSLADVFAFRYRSRWAGTLTTIFLFIAIMPLIALQIQAVTNATAIFNPNNTSSLVGLGFCAMMIAFTILYGARRAAPNERHRSLIFAIAFESLIKLIIFLILGAVALYTVFDGFNSLDAWLLEKNIQINGDGRILPGYSWAVLMLMFLLAPLTMPHMFQVIFRETKRGNFLRFATWAFPIYLLLMSLPVLPILWAGIATGGQIPPEYHALGLGIALESPTLALLGYLGGISAASGLIILGTIAMASMMLNHILLPFHRPKPEQDIYEWILWMRRYLVFCIIAAGYIVYLFLGQVHNLSSLGIASFVGTLQLLPGILGTLFWNNANRNGFISGLFAGMIIWISVILYPIILESLLFDFQFPQILVFDNNVWTSAAIVSLSINLLIFIVVSIATKTSPEEIVAANACIQNGLIRPQKKQLVAKNTQDFIQSLSPALGRISADREVSKALTELDMPLGEFRPLALKQLRDRLETNLSGLMGPSVSSSVINRYLPFKDSGDFPAREDINQIENQLENFQTQLTGMAAELDRLRRYHRETLEQLPMGVCSVSNDGEILMWNQALVEITHIPANQTVGSYLDSLPESWHLMLKTFLVSPSDHLYKQELKLDQDTKWINLHKAALPTNSRSIIEGTVLLVEDQTELNALENELLHSERLASIGSLAAGVAHEIGNPVTGIDCLAQDLIYSADSDESKEIGEQIRGQTQRVTRIVQSLVNYAHSGQQDANIEHLNHSIYDLVNEAIHLLELSRQSHDVNFINNIPQHLLVPCDPQRLAQAFINLLNNAKDASAPGNDIIIGLHESTGEHKTRLEIVDHGTGIPKEILDRIYEPFFTTKGVGKGTGLGLWLTYSIIEEHFGHINFESPAFPLEENGTRVIITLPKPQETELKQDIE